MQRQTFFLSFFLSFLPDVLLFGLDLRCSILQLRLSHQISSAVWWSLFFRCKLTALWNTFRSCSCVCFASFIHLAGLTPSYPNSEQDRLMARTSTHILGVELNVRRAHERRLHDVATLTILQEPAMVQVHLLARCLEIQSNWRKNTTHLC